MKLHLCCLESLCTPLTRGFPSMHWAEGIEAPQTGLISVTMGFLAREEILCFIIHCSNKFSVERQHILWSLTWFNTFTTVEVSVPQAAARGKQSWTVEKMLVALSEEVVWALTSPLFVPTLLHCRFPATSLSFYLIPLSENPDCWTQHHALKGFQMSVCMFAFSLSIK